VSYSPRIRASSASSRGDHCLQSFQRFPRGRAAADDVIVLRLTDLADGSHEPPRCHGSRIDPALALRQTLDAGSDATDRMLARMPPTARRCLRDARRGLPGFDYGDGLHLLSAFTPAPRLSRPYLIDHSGSRRVRFGAAPGADRKAPNTMTTKAQDWAARTRRELDRDRVSKRRSEAIASRRSLNARRTDRAGAKTDPFGPINPRFAYLTRTYD
jgi:hypothetical protein